MSEKFSLKRDDFKEASVNNFSKLRLSSEYNDVTLVGEDHKNISAHKLILSSSSEYFRSILKEHEGSHSLICLDGVSSQDIENFLNLIYTGVLQIFQEDLERFLKLSQRLKLEGLVELDGLVENHNKSSRNCIKDEIQPLEENVSNESVVSDENEKNQPVLKFSSDCLPSTEELDLTIKGNIKKSINGYECICCGRVFKASNHAVEHVEAQHTEGLQFQCDICDKINRTRRALKLYRKRMNHNKSNVNVIKDEMQSFEEYASNENIKFDGNKICFTSDCSVEKLNHTLKTYIKKSVNGFNCIICERVFRLSCNAIGHVEDTHTEGLQFRCDFCDKSYRTRKGLRGHRNQLNHKQIKPWA